MKKKIVPEYFVCGIIALLLIPVFLPAQHASEKRQILHLDFSEGSGNIAHNKLPGGLTAKLVTGTEWSAMPDAVTFKKNGSVLLINDTVNIGAVFTISFRIRVPASRTADRIIIAKGLDSKSASHFQLRLDKGTGILRFVSLSLSGDMSSGLTVDDNAWHQIAISYAHGWMKFYKDGSLIKASKVEGVINDAADVLAIGALSNGSGTLGGSITDLSVYKSVLNPEKIFNLFTNKLACWNMNEGMGVTTLSDEGNASYGMLNGPINTYDNFGKASTGWLKSAVWEKDKKFGNVLNFKVERAAVVIENANHIKLKNQFTLACWIKTPAKRSKPRIIVSKGSADSTLSYFDWRLEAGTGYLTFYSPSLNGNTNSGIRVDDAKWHHIAISYTAGKMSFYKDGLLIRTNIVSGSIADADAAMTIGAGNGFENSFSGELSRLKLFGSALSPTQIKDICNETESAGWNLDEGLGELVHDSNADKNNGIIHNGKWATGKGSSFSRVIDLSNANSYISIENTSINLSGRFTLSAWMQVAPGRTSVRTILAKGKPRSPGYFSWQMEAGSGNLRFNATGLSGDMNSGFQIDDNKWHHVMISYGDGVMKFYKDRQLIRTTNVKGVVASSSGVLSIGASADGAMPVNARLAQVKIYNAVKTAEQVTPVVPPTGTRLNLKRGIVFDRIQNQNFPVIEEWQIRPNDIAVAKSMGFDHIKVLLTADQYILDSGLNMPHMYYVDQMVNTALASGLPVVVDLHPEGAFKARYLGTDTGYADMLGFYRAFGKYLAERWTPDQIAFQLMTEPFGNKAGPKKGDWNDLTPPMVAAARLHMPDYTLIVSGDRAGNIYAMTSLVPLRDDNIYYSFTTYEPYRFGFNTLFGGWRGEGKYWKDISYIPWPSSPEIVAARIDDMLSAVKEEDKPRAKEDLLEYGKSYFNRQWMNRRAMNVSEWNESYGGNLQIIVAEFGALDHVKSRSSGASKGIYPNERIEFVRDLRQSFESVGMGWEYWSFNEYFTIFEPEIRKPYGQVSKEMAEMKMLQALGL